MTPYGQTFALWRAEAGTSWTRYTRHGFVRGLGDGSLPREAYLRYLVQDYLFLIQFSRAWALAVTKADSVDEMRHAAATVDLLINREIALHVRTCAAAGLDEHMLITTPEHVATIAYTRYVLDAGHAGDLLDLLAALAPCVMGYGEIGLSLHQSATSERYADWITTYSGEAYQQGCRQVGELIDNAILRRLGPAPRDTPRWSALALRFETATRLEAGFWTMGLEG